MSNHEDTSIAGGWLGTYYYRDGAPPVRFEATFVTSGTNSGFSGTILDDGAGGEAKASGQQQGRQIQFRKIYNSGRRYAEPVDYEGTLSEDGRLINGVWNLREDTGHWEAHRLWSASSETESEMEGEAASELALIDAQAR